MDEVSIEFDGAAGTVTGSKHLVKTPEGNILIDCGLFQGLKEHRLKNWEDFPFQPADIKFLILTHAHLDHCGAIPRLVKQGFSGQILTTAPTRELAEIILLDSAKIQEEDAARANMYRFSKHDPALPLYTQEDVRNSLSYFRVCPEKELIQLCDNISIQFLRNGHILGSCFICMECFGRRIVFSGDVGRYNSPVLDAPVQIEKADFLILESTYGNRLHDTIPAENVLCDVIHETIHKKGNLLIPSFAVGRAQELMFMIHQLKRENKIPPIPLYLDTPMGSNATDTFMHFPGWHKLSEHECQEMLEHVFFVHDYAETEQVVTKKGPKIVIAASGMLTGGRVLTYLKEYLSEPRNTILLAGYQSEGTRGRALKEGAHEIKIEGEYYPVYAEIREITSLSAHADQKELLRWLSGFSQKPATVFLVHGEPMALDAFRMKLEKEMGGRIIVPKEKEVFLLNV